MKYAIKDKEFFFNKDKENDFKKYKQKYFIL